MNAVSIPQPYAAALLARPGSTTTWSSRWIRTLC
jgi:hypothetical protein